MGEKRYMISDASRMLGVESHVLRYWEEELNIVIPRNEMGHRYYTDNHINLLKNVRDLKNQGYGLRTIKMMLTDPDTKEGKNNNCRNNMALTATAVSAPVLKEQMKVETIESSESKMEQFQAIMDKVVSKAIKKSAGELGKEVSGNVSEKVLKEMNYLMRTQDEREEERYKKLDMAMRSKQKLSRREKRQQLKTEKLLLKKTKKEEQRLKQEKQKKLAAEKKKGDLKIGKKAPAQ